MNEPKATFTDEDGWNVKRINGVFIYRTKDLGKYALITEIDCWAWVTDGKITDEEHGVGRKWNSPSSP